jgi:hypothetical protein
MSENVLLEIHKQHRTGQDKYTYFLLAVAASAVAFSVQKTDGMKIAYSLIPLGGAILLWGLSFYFGVKNIVWVQSSIYANFNLLQLKNGVHPNQPAHPVEQKAAMEGVSSAMEKNSKKAQFYGAWQFRLLIAGAVLFLIWHILEMVLRTNGSP